MRFELLIIYFAGGFGGWSTRGCFLREESDTNATCECDHLTNFGILLVHSSGMVLIAILNFSIMNIYELPVFTFWSMYTHAVNFSVS